MTRSKWLMAAAVLAFSVQTAGACDDYAEEMAIAKAREAAKLAQSAAPPPAASAEVSAPPAATATGIASADPKQAETAGTVQR